MTFSLRPYQTEAIQSVRADWDAGYTDVLGTAATGLGKTAIFCALLQQVMTPGKRALVLAHRRELVNQPAERLISYYPEWAGKVGTLMAEQHEPDRPLTVATVQSLSASPRRLADLLAAGPIDYLIVDEAHHHTDKNTYMGVTEALRAANPAMRHLGVTATPLRADGDGLGGVYQKESFHLPIGWAVKSGWLVNIRWLAIETAISLAGVKVVRGEFQRRGLAQVYETDALLGIVVESYRQYASDRQAIAFTVTVDGAHRLAAAFRAAGVRADAADGGTDKAERAAVLDRFARGETQVLCNVGLYTEGLDIPAASCILMARPTKSDGLYVQCMGRGVRTYPGKADCIAEGQRVLTDHGLVAIERVTRSMKVWDGDEFVSHAGTICRGEQEVITYAGLTATPDHKVWTENGWRRFSECADKSIPIAVTGSGGTAIRTANGYRRNASAEEWACLPKNALHNLRERGTLVPDKCSQRFGWLPEMWSSQHPRTRTSDCSEVALQASASCTAAVYQCARPRVSQLRRQGHRIQIRFPQSDGNLGQGKSWSASGDADRPHQQQRTLRAGELALCDQPGECVQQPEAESQRGVSRLSYEVPGSEICRCNSAQASARRDDTRKDCGKVSPTILQAKRRVWDILNAGPNHRFTAEGLLVSNCLILDFAPAEKRNVIMAGDVLGIPLPKRDVFAEPVARGEAAAGFTYDGQFSFLDGSPVELISRQLNYLEISPWSWYRRDNYLTLGLGEAADGVERTLVITPQREGEVTLWGVWREGRAPLRSTRLASGAFGEIEARAEEIAAKWGSAALAAKTRSWRGQAPTDKQLAFARRIGAHRAGMTKGELAQSITHTLAVRVVQQGAVV
jgi:superfamily II DNA or RNA helicase